MTPNLGAQCLLAKLASLVKKMINGGLRPQAGEALSSNPYQLLPPLPANLYLAIVCVGDGKNCFYSW